MRFWGHHDAQVTDSGADGGIDVWSSSALGQVKFEAAQVGAPAVQKLVGAAGRDGHKQLFFFSGAGYSQQAVTYAATMSVALFRYNLLGEMTAVNDAAQFTSQMPPPTSVHFGNGNSRPSPRPAQGRLAGLQGDDDPRTRAAINGVVNFPRDVVREWASVTYQRSRPLEGSRATKRRGWWGRNWQWFLTVLFVIAALGNMSPASETSAGPNPGGALSSLLLAAIFGGWGYLKRRRGQAWRRGDTSLPMRVQELPSEVADVVRNLPTVIHQGWPSEVAEYERVRAELDSFIEEGEFVSDSLVWAFYVRPRSAGSLREWIDSRPSRLAQIPRGW
ncbi:MAG: restriction endonuclease [Humibacillus sp.]|nr:restriction endonuclease [Humibacillus sp.]MDN5778638.1 restriction endonuclease [Humibacillus sp.]